jgi:hypothetical protein
MIELFIHYHLVDFIAIFLSRRYTLGLVWHACAGDVELMSL